MSSISTERSWLGSFGLIGPGRTNRPPSHMHLLILMHPHAMQCPCGTACRLYSCISRFNRSLVGRCRRWEFEVEVNSSIENGDQVHIQSKIQVKSLASINCSHSPTHTSAQSFPLTSRKDRQSWCPIQTTGNPIQQWVSGPIGSRRLGLSLALAENCRYQRRGFASACSARGSVSLDH